MFSSSIFSPFFFVISLQRINRPTMLFIIDIKLKRKKKKFFPDFYHRVFLLQFEFSSCVLRPTVACCRREMSSKEKKKKDFRIRVHKREENFWCCLLLRIQTTTRKREVIELAWRKKKNKFYFMYIRPRVRFTFRIGIIFFAPP
jgi:hypothetical protein